MFLLYIQVSLLLSSTLHFFFSLLLSSTLHFPSSSLYFYQILFIFLLLLFTSIKYSSFSFFFSLLSLVKHHVCLRTTYVQDAWAAFSIFLAHHTLQTVVRNCRAILEWRVAHNAPVYGTAVSTASHLSCGFDVRVTDRTSSITI